MEQQPLRPNGQHARQLIVAFWVLFGVTIITVITNYLYYQFIAKGDFSTEALDAITMRQVIVALLTFVVNIVCIVFFIMWFRRAYANLHRHGVTWLTYQEGWASLAWFTPFLNLVRPFQIMREIWIETQEAYLGRDKAESDLIIIFWWIFFLLSNFVDIFGSQIQNSYVVEEMLMGTVIILIGNALTLIAILITIEMVKRTNQFEEKLYLLNHEVDISDHLIGEAIE